MLVSAKSGRSTFMQGKQSAKLRRSALGILHIRGKINCFWSALLTRRESEEEELQKQRPIDLHDGFASDDN